MVRSTTIAKLGSSIVNDIMGGSNKLGQQLDTKLKIANRVINITSRLSVESIEIADKASENIGNTVLENGKYITAKNNRAYGLKIKVNKILVGVGKELNNNKHTITNIPGIKSNTTDSRVYRYK